jgi:phospholipase/lecithinase/hemolysin
MRGMFRMFLVALCALAAVPATTAADPPRHAAAPVYDAFYTFGDSLADTGNVWLMTRMLQFMPPLPPSESPNRTYFEGRFSNGPVGFERLWDLLRSEQRAPSQPLRPFLSLGTVPRKGAVDFSFGGSGSGVVSETPGGFLVPGLKGQVEIFLSQHKGRLSPRALFAIVTGSNDYLRTPPATPADPAMVVQDIVDAVEQLHARGARSVIVLNLIDLGSVPLVAGDPVLSAALSQLSDAHNTLLAGALAQLAATRPSLDLVIVDLPDVLATLPSTMNLSTPAIDLMFPAPWTPYPLSLCLFVEPATCPDVPTFDVGPDYFYWDVVHPTSTLHQALAEYLYERLR